MKLYLLNLVTISELFSFIICDNFVISQHSAQVTTHEIDTNNLDNNFYPVIDHQEIDKVVRQVSLNIDKFIDLIVETIRLGGNGLDPMTLPNVDERFNEKILFVNVDGEFLMRHGKLYNLKSISRLGNATLRYDHLKLYVDTAFIFDKLDFNYNFVSKIVSLGPNGFMKGDAKQLIVQTTFAYDILKPKFTLNEISLADKVPVNVQVEISVVIDWFYKLVFKGRNKDISSSKYSIIFVRKVSKNNHYKRNNRKMKIVAEYYIQNYFQSLAKHKKVIPGLILGQSNNDKAYFIHAVRNQDYDEVLSDGSTEDIEKYSGPLIDHAQQVTRMLPGGTYVLGIFLMSNDNIFDREHVNSIHVLVRHIKDHLKPDEAKHLNFVVHYNFFTDKLNCRTFDQLARDTGLTLDYKKLTWYHVQSYFNFDELPSLYFAEEVSLKAQADFVLQKVEAVLNDCLFTFNNKVCDMNASVKALVGKKNTFGDNKKNPLNVNIHAQCPFKENLEKDIYFEKSFIAKIICQGILGSNIYLHEDSTVGDAIIAVKNDIKRSLTSRLEMHLFSLLEGEVNFQEMKTVHEPPRRILINLPASDVQLSDYLFPGETLSEVSEALESLKDLLDIDVRHYTIQKDFEDPSVTCEDQSPAATPIKPEIAVKRESNSFGFSVKIMAITLFVILFAFIYQVFIKN